MTTLALSLLLKTEGAPAAKAAVQDVAKATDQLASATTRGTTADKAAATAMQASARAAQQVGRANQIAAGATGNLVAQFNDIGMMLMAGQNPLQLAIQQGTQITQVIGPMGAAGAAKALGGAFLGMLNPLNLVTLGMIAAGAAAVQWLTSADDDAAGVAEQLERQKAALEGIVAETEKLRLARGMMTSGAQSDDEQVAFEEINRLLQERREIAQQLEEQQATMRRAAGIGARTVAEARERELQAEIAIIDAKLAALEKQRELNAATERSRTIAESVKTATQGITSTLQAADGGRLVAAFQAAFPAANSLLALAQGIVATLDQATPFKSAQSGELAAQYALYGQGRVIGERLARESGSLYGGKSVLPQVRTGTGAGTGGGAAARDEANALQELIESLEGEIEALRVQNPIQQELLRHREALAGATEAERLKVEELIATRERERAAMEGAKERAEFFEDLGNNALEALIVKGESFNDVLKNIAQSLIQAALQATLFGEGPFGSLFGGKSMFSLLMPGAEGKATGGMVHGPGSGTSDSILTRLSNGEYVVNAKATARNRHLLEAINAGGLPGYAQGGAVGQDNRRMGARGSREMPAQIYMDLRGSQGDQAIEEKVRKGAAQMISLYDREGLPVSIQRVSGDAKRRG